MHSDDIGLNAPFVNAFISLSISRHESMTLPQKVYREEKDTVRGMTMFRSITSPDKLECSDAFPIRGNAATAAADRIDLIASRLVMFIVGFIS